MRVLAALTTLLGTALALPASQTVPTLSLKSRGFTRVNPGPVADMIVSKETTLNGTRSGPVHTVPPATARIAAAAQAILPLSLNNNMGVGINAYITGLDPNNAVVFIRADGSLVYPSSGGSKVPVPITQNIAIPINARSSLSMQIPIAISSARIYFAQGNLAFGVVATPIGDGIVQPAPNNLNDPSSNVNWGFVELTLLANGTLYANISYVDFVGIILGMSLAVNGGPTQSTLGLSPNAVTSICNDLSSQQRADGRPWSSMCIAGSGGAPLRVLSPNDYTSIDPNGFATYWNSYVDQVWSKYSSSPLTINTQSGAGNVACNVNGNTLNCNGDNRGYAKPSASDIWGCNGGPFLRQAGDNDVHIAVIPRLCAAFTRTTLLMAGGNVQPSLGATSYYKNNPTNHYSRIVHNYEQDGRGYAFSYDDVNPDGNENASGTVSSGSPNRLTVFIGGQN